MSTRRIEVFQPEDRQFEQIGGDSGDVRIAWDIGRDKSNTIACGIATFNNCALDWTVNYEEYIYCLEGTLTLKIREEKFVLKPGNGIWLPEGTQLVYEAERAVAVYTIYPADWRERTGRST